MHPPCLSGGIGELGRGGVVGDVGNALEGLLDYHSFRHRISAQRLVTGRERYTSGDSGCNTNDRSRFAETFALGEFFFKITDLLLTFRAGTSAWSFVRAFLLNQLDVIFVCDVASNRFQVAAHLFTCTHILLIFSLFFDDILQFVELGKAQILQLKDALLSRGLGVEVFD